MKNYHLNVRRYDQPLTLIIYENKIVNGVVSFVEKERFNIKASIMQAKSYDVSNHDRADTNTLSVMIPNPPFILSPEKTKVMINNQIYSVLQVDFNQLTYAETKLLVKYERENEESNCSVLEGVLEGVLCG